MALGNDNSRWVRVAGTCAADGWATSITDAEDGWSHTSLRVAELAAGQSISHGTGSSETVIVPLSGGATVRVVAPDSTQHEIMLAGRATVFAGPSDVAYVPPGSTITLQAGDVPARIAVCGAVVSDPGSSQLPVRHLRAGEVPVELRGAGMSSREVRNFATPGVLDASSMIACEVITPAGNWSSWPPHKHDEDRPGVESELEEIYYFEVAAIDGAPDPAGLDPVGYQRVYGTAQRPIDVLAEVRTGDVVLVPHGWHGPAIAAPDAHLYYLNVMAGPGAERVWLICDDPAHGWIRDTWNEQSVDSRLPLGGTS